MDSDNRYCTPKIDMFIVLFFFMYDIWMSYLLMLWLNPLQYLSIQYNTLNLVKVKQQENVIRKTLHVHTCMCIKQF